eukprot:2685120-Prymnesium_polylepis.1
MEGEAEAMEQNHARCGESQQSSKDQTRPNTAQTRETTLTRQALTNQTRDTVCTQIWTCAGNVTACGGHDGTW